MPTRKYVWRITRYARRPHVGCASPPNPPQQLIAPCSLLARQVVHENADSDKELAHLLNMIDQSNRKLLVDLLTVALRRHSLLCYPLELLASICQCATLDKLTNVSPLSVVRPLQSSHPTTLSTHLSTHLTSRQRRSPRCFTLTAQ